MLRRVKKNVIRAHLFSQNAREYVLYGTELAVSTSFRVFSSLTCVTML